MWNISWDVRVAEEYKSPRKSNKDAKLTFCDCVSLFCDRQLFSLHDSPAYILKAYAPFTAASYFSSQWLLMVRILLFALKNFICSQWLRRSQGYLAYNFNMWESDLFINFDLFYLQLPLVTIYKSFIRPHFDYRGFIYYQGYVTSFHQDAVQHIT